MSDYVPTLADVCSAIAEGQLAAVFDGTEYQVNALELRRYFQRMSLRPTISTSSEQDPSAPTHSNVWSAPASISVA